MCPAVPRNLCNSHFKGHVNGFIAFLRGGIDCVQFFWFWSFFFAIDDNATARSLAAAAVCVLKTFSLGCILTEGHGAQGHKQWDGFFTGCPPAFFHKATPTHRAVSS